MSLPGMLGTCPENVPANVPYIQADPDLVLKWRQELKGVDGFKIGIAWQGRPTYRGDRQRSIALEEFTQLAAVRGVKLISLQKGVGIEQLSAQAGRCDVLEWGNRLDESAGPFMDTAAVMMNCDLVITSDTAIAHLAGALGVPVWVALNAVPDWRWLLDRDDSPWYPTMRLFRQKEKGCWADVFQFMSQEVKTLAAGLAT
jgi:hypothetical protein